MKNTLLQEARTALPEANVDVSDDLAMKQLVHSQILLAMDDVGLLDTATFQGGSSITNCYGGIRLSEDLDFTVSTFPDENVCRELSARIVGLLERRFGAQPTVKLPKRAREAGGEAKVPVERFRIKVPYIEDRPDIPWLYVKLELAKVDRSTSVPIEINPLVRIDGARELMPIVLAEEAAEIVADKVIAFAGTTTWTRTRDLFDMYWLLTRERVDLDDVAKLVGKKLDDYGLKREVLISNVKSYREALYGSDKSVEALAQLRGMLVDGSWAQRIATSRGAMAVVGKALDCCESALSQQQYST